MVGLTVPIRYTRLYTSIWQRKDVVNNVDMSSLRASWQYTRTRPCLTVLGHVWFVLKPYWSYDDRLKTYVRTSCTVVYTISHVLSRSCATAYTIIHGHDIRTRVANRVSRVLCVRYALNKENDSLLLKLFINGNERGHIQ